MNIIQGGIHKNIRFYPFLNKSFEVESLSLTLSIFHESLLMTPGFFPEKQRNIYTATLMIVDWNISIL
jgi:hypothetical protein